MLPTATIRATRRKSGRLGLPATLFATFSRFFRLQILRQIFQVARCPPEQRGQLVTGRGLQLLIDVVRKFCHFSIDRTSGIFEVHNPSHSRFRYSNQRAGAGQMIFLTGPNTHGL